MHMHAERNAVIKTFPCLATQYLQLHVYVCALTIDATMDGPTNPPSRSPEVEAFRHYYNRLLNDVRYPVQLARSLLTKGIISSETKNAITSDKDVEGKRVLLDAVEHALMHASDREAMFRSLVEALRSFHSDYYQPTSSLMTNFVDGEHRKYCD